MSRMFDDFLLILKRRVLHLCSSLFHKSCSRKGQFLWRTTGEPVKLHYRVTQRVFSSCILYRQTAIIIHDPHARYSASSIAGITVCIGNKNSKVQKAPHVLYQQQQQLQQLGHLHLSPLATSSANTMEVVWLQHWLVLLTQSQSCGWCCSTNPLCVCLE